MATNRSYTPATTRLLAEYLANHFPHARIFQEFHLTEPNDVAVKQAGGNVSPRFGGTIIGYPDAAVIADNHVALWEAKATLNYAAVGQIEGYGEAWKRSVEARKYPGYQVTLHILAARDNPAVREFAMSKGIDVVVYAPDWFAASYNRKAAEHESVKGTQAVTNAG